MRRITVIAAAVCAAALAWYLWPARGGAVAQPDSVSAPPPGAAAARGDDAPQWMQTVAEPQQEPERVPLPPVDSSAPAWLSMAEARENGDPRSPPVMHDDPSAHVLPTAEQLADPQAYRQFEQGQHARLLASFAEAAKDEVPRLRSDLERGKAAGVPEAELAKMEEKIRRIEALREGVVQGTVH